MRRPAMAIALLATALVGCLSWSKGPEQVVYGRAVHASREPLGELTPGWGVVLVGEEALAGMLPHCSRPTIHEGRVRSWTPKAAEVEQLERLLPAFLSSHDARPPKPLGAYYRQYVGYMTRGHWYIYANFFPSDWLTDMLRQVPEVDWKRYAVNACDVDSDFWGVSFDVDQRTFSGLAFNYGPRG